MSVLAVGVLLTSALIPLGAVIQGADWWLTAIVAMAVVFVPAGVVRSLGGASWIGTLAGAAAWILGLVIVYAPGSAVLGVVPTPETLIVFRDLSVEAGRSLYVQSVPVEPIAPILFLLAVGIGAIAVIADVAAVSLRSPALTGLLAVAMIVPPSVFTGSIDLVAYAIAAVAYLLVLRTDGRRPSGGAPVSSRSSALVVGAAAVAATVVAATLVPTFSTRSLVQPDGESAFGSGISELADLGRDLQRPGNTPHFQYQTTSTTAQYLRMLTLDRFEGTRWTSSGDHSTVEQVDGERVAVPGLTDGVATEEATVDVTITGLVGDLLPVPFPSISIDGLTGEWQWDTEGLTVSSEFASVEGQEYSVTSLVIRPTAEQLRNAPADYPVEAMPFLDLPDDVPDTLRSVFDEVTAGSTNAYDAAFAIQQYLRTDFRYSVATPVDEGYDGDGFEAIADFLEKKSGYCVHFASAMAVLSRMAGIPARVSLGYLPGDRVRSDDDGTVAYRVGSDDLHAWPELYFTGVGWVPFEPTPGRGAAPSYALPAGTDTDPDDVPSGAPTRLPSATPTPSASSGAGPLSGAQERPDATAPSTALGIALLLVFLVLLAVPAAVRTARWRRRLTSAQAYSTVLPLWAELVDSSADLGYPSPPADSERDIARRLGRALDGSPEAGDALERLLAATEAERYASRPGSVEQHTVADRRADVAVVVAALARTTNRLGRVRAALLPPSALRPRSDVVGARRDRRRPARG